MLSRSSMAISESIPFCVTTISHSLIIFNTLFRSYWARYLFEDTIADVTCKDTTTCSTALVPPPPKNP